MKTSAAAFSLVELSIVLVILGLLTGGILAGQAMIRASELRSVMTDANKYISSAQAFRDRYGALPGDFRDGTKYWGRLNANADCVTNSGAAVNANTGVCDGDGDWKIRFANSPGQSGEFAQFWRELQQAGYIEGSFSGLSPSGTGGGSTSQPGYNAPATRIANGVWGVHYEGIYPGSAAWQFTGDWGTLFNVGGWGLGSWGDANLFTPAEAYAIDKKMDDGAPGTGRVIASNIAVCANAASITDYNATYTVSNTSLACALYFIKAL